MSRIYFIRALTNMHVGDGQANYGIIDNLVQKDVLTGYPTIHSSSLKGALKQYFDYLHRESPFKEKDLVEYVFGSDEMSGSYRFLDAHLLCIPVRSNLKPYYLASCPKIFQFFIELAEILEIPIPFKEELQKMIQCLSGLEQNTCCFFGSPTNDLSEGEIEGYGITKAESPFSNDSVKNSFEKIFGSLEGFVLFPNKTFSEYIDDLPVIARNRLENGLSVNLWYEEIVPRESRFFFGLLCGSKYKNEFHSSLMDHFIQIGANASIGYGFSEIYESLRKPEGANNE